MSEAEEVEQTPAPNVAFVKKNRSDKLRKRTATGLCRCARESQHSRNKYMAHHFIVLEP